jgi:two-component system OmpR family response regulator
MKGDPMIRTSDLSGNGPAPGDASVLRVLLIEDDPLTREVLGGALVGAGYHVHAEADGRRVERIAGMFRPHIALIDMHLGDSVDGITVAKRLRSTDSVPLLFINAAAVDDVLATFDAGGDDYVVKPFVMAELLFRMKAILHRSGRQGRRVLEVADLVVDEGAHAAVRAGTMLELTHREFEILTTLCHHRGVVLSKSQLLAKVWGFDQYDPNVIEVHISALRRKLEAEGTRLIHTVRGVGYVLRP